ncbi:MAG: hypothetical protein HRU08_07395, partial [Oleispira sp.]|nr:hypothetical protein [Oleispira sp.]
MMISGQWHYLNSSEFDVELSARDQYSVHNVASFAGDGKFTDNMYISKTRSGTNWWQANLFGMAGKIQEVRIRTREGTGYRIDGARVMLDGKTMGVWSWD